MHPESRNQSADLRTLLSRAAEAASYSGRKMMESAGLSWQSLAAWKAGTRKPRAESIRAVGHALLLRGDRISRIGIELIRAAEQASGEVRPTMVTDDGPQRVLFGPSPVVALKSPRRHDDGAEAAPNGLDGSATAPIIAERSEGD